MHIYTIFSFFIMRKLKKTSTDRVFERSDNSHFQMSLQEKLDGWAKMGGGGGSFVQVGPGHLTQQLVNRNPLCSNFPKILRTKLALFVHRVRLANTPAPQRAIEKCSRDGEAEKRQYSLEKPLCVKVWRILTHWRIGRRDGLGQDMPQVLAVWEREQIEAEKKPRRHEDKTWVKNAKEGTCLSRRT